MQLPEVKRVHMRNLCGMAFIDQCLTFLSIKKRVRARHCSHFSFYKIIGIVLWGSLQGCTTSSGIQNEFDPATQARIRVFHGTAVYLHLGGVCDGNPRTVIHAGAGGFSYLERNKKIGMPATDDMPFSYHEYAIPANRPLTVMMHWQAQKASGVWESCGPIYTSFTPKAGQDYDTFMAFHRGVCQGVQVRELSLDGNGKVTTTAAPINGLPFRQCR